MTTLAPFKHLVHLRCGLHLEGLAEARLFRAIATLQATTGLTDTSSLLSRLTDDSALFDGFVSQLTVNETYFYREPEALDWLVNTYLPLRLAEGHKPLAIFSAGCSSGEEPYSVAMKLFERFGERAKQLFTLSGGDLDQQILTKARQGIYSGMAFRALPPALKARYFSPYGNRFKLNDSVRKWVTFHPFNLLNANTNSAAGPFDVILFRNVSIYFDKPTRRHIHQQLRPLLAPNGILLCGVTETLGNDLGVFELVDAEGVFYFQHTEKAKLADTEQPRPPPAPVVPQSVIEEGSVEVSHGIEAPTISFCDQLHTAHQLLNQNAFDQADSLLQVLIEQQPWSVDALILAGLVARWQQQPNAAYEHFKRAIYVAPECWPAHFYLAELYRQGELADEPIQRQRSYAAVVRLLAADPTSNGRLDTIAPPLPPGDARFLAERHLNAANTTLDVTSTTQGVG